jgi:hypothetical protein
MKMELNFRRSNLYTSLQYKLNYTLCSLKYLFNYRGEQTHFKGKRTQGEYVSIRGETDFMLLSCLKEEIM